MPYIEVTAQGNSGTDKVYLTMRVAGLENEAIDYAIFIRKDATGETSGQLGNGLEHYSDTVTWTGLEPSSSYSFTALVTPNGSYERPYQQDITTPARSGGGGTNPTRPTNFSWTVAKTNTDPPTLSVSEWNGLLDKINEFRTYKGLSQITTFIRASSNAVFTADQFNQAVNIINTLSPTTAPPATVTKDSIMYASQLNGLVTSLNSIS